MLLTTAYRAFAMTGHCSALPVYEFTETLHPSLELGAVADVGVSRRWSWHREGGKLAKATRPASGRPGI